MTAEPVPVHNVPRLSSLPILPKEVIAKAAAAIADSQAPKTSALPSLPATPTLTASASLPILSARTSHSSEAEEESGEYANSPGTPSPIADVISADNATRRSSAPTLGAHEPSLSPPSSPRHKKDIKKRGSKTPRGKEDFFGKQKKKDRKEKEKEKEKDKEERGRSEKGGKGEGRGRSKGREKDKGEHGEGEGEENVEQVRPSLKKSGTSRLRIGMLKGEG